MICQAIRIIAVDLKSNAAFTLDREYKPYKTYDFWHIQKISVLTGCRLFSYSVSF